MPNSGADRTTILVFVLLIWLHIGIHECGHALAAWIVGFRVKAFGIGPLVFHREQNGFRPGFGGWRRLLVAGGYVGAVPTSHERIWPNQIAVVAGGPAASFAAGVVFALGFFLLPGTPLAKSWHDVAIGSLLGFYLGALNLIPVGYTDGTILLHLILRTRRGEEFIARSLNSLNRQDAQDRSAAGDYRGSTTHQREALERLLKQGDPDPSRLAEELVGLGRMEVASEQWSEAEQHLRQSLDLSAKGEPNPSRDATCWTCLHRVYLYRHDAASAEEAYQKALAARESLRLLYSTPIDRLTNQDCIAELHMYAHAFEPALEETARALAGFPNHREYRLLKGRLLSIRARSALQCGDRELGLAAADEAADIFRSEHHTEGVAALHQLGYLGWSVWEGGLTPQALALVTECVGLLETRGAMDLAARFRLCVAHILLADGRTAEAACVLPGLDRVGRDLRKHYVDQRAAIRRKAAKWADALKDASEGLSLTLEDTPGDELAIALARSALAEAYLNAGQLTAAEETAQQAYRGLVACGHPERADTCITLALVGWQKERSTGGYFEEAMRVWEEAPLVPAANKARFLEQTSDRLERAGLPEEAARCRDAAECHWRRLGRSGRDETHEARSVGSPSRGLARVAD